MSPVSVINGKAIPCFEHSGFSHSWYDEAEVANDEYIVPFNYTSASYPVVASFSKKFSGNMVIRALFILKRN